MEYQTSRTSYEVQTESYGEWVTAAVADNLADARKSFHKIAWPGQTVRIVRLTTLVTEQELYYLAGVSS